jgi:hypothetical protein
MSAKSKRLTAILATGMVLVGTALFCLFFCFVHHDALRRLCLIEIAKSAGQLK